MFISVVSCWQQRILLMFNNYYTWIHLNTDLNQDPDPSRIRPDPYPDLIQWFRIRTRSIKSTGYPARSGSGAPLFNMRSKMTGSLLIARSEIKWMMEKTKTVVNQSWVRKAVRLVGWRDWRLWWLWLSRLFGPVKNFIYCSVTLLFTIIDKHMSKNPFSQCNLVSRKRALRSIPNLHHWKGLLLAVLNEYKLDRVWIRGSGVIRSQSPKILTPDLVDPRDPSLQVRRVFVIMS